MLVSSVGFLSHSSERSDKSLGLCFSRVNVLVDIEYLPNDVVVAEGLIVAECAFSVAEARVGENGLPPFLLVTPALLLLLLWYCCYYWTAIKWKSQ